MQKGKNELAALTGLRFIAALMVMVYHYFGGKPFSFLNVLVELYTGVSVFFTLSGFIIAYNYYESATFTARFWRCFLLKRFARIYPLYWILLSIYYLNLWRTSTPQSTEAIMSFTLLKGFSHTYFLTGISQSWSLLTEECFYLLAPLIFVFNRKNFGLFWWVILSALFGVFLWLTFGKINFYGFFTDINFIAHVTFFGRCFEFIAGIFTYKLYQYSSTSSGLKKGFSNTIGAWLLFYLFLLIFRGMDQSLGNDFKMLKIAAHNFLVPIATSAIIWTLLTESNWLNDLLSGRLFNLLGKSSYALYLLHLGLFAEFIYFHVVKNYLFVGIAMIVLSCVFYLLIEKPARNQLLKLWNIS